MNISKLYSEEEIQFIKTNYHCQGGKWCAIKLNRNPDSVRHKAMKMGLKASREILQRGARERFSSLKNHYDEIKQNYKTKGVKWCMDQFGLQRQQVLYLAQKFKIEWEKQPEDYKVNHLDLLNVDDPRKAYLLGLIWTDGHISKTNNSISLTTTEPDASYYYNIVMFTGKWGVYRNQNKEKGWKERVQFCTMNRYLHSFLKDNDFSNKMDGMAKIYHYIPNKYRIYFLRGVIDGDGNIYVDEDLGQYSLSICSGHDQNWNIMEQVAKDLDLDYKIERTISKTGSYSKFHIHGKMRVVKLCDWIYNGYEQDGVGLKRKHEKYVRIKARCKTWVTSKTLIPTPSL